MKQILITGANRGIGLEFVKQYLALKHSVIGTCRSPHDAASLLELERQYPGQLTLMKLDVGLETSIGDCAQKLANINVKLDLIINNAGILISGERFRTLSARHLSESFVVNAAGPMLLTQALAPLLSPGSKVVNVSSILGSIASTQSFYTPSYCISKAALNMATKLLSYELEQRKIIVFAVHPGWVKTDMGGENAKLEIEASVNGLMRVIENASEAAQGRFFSWENEEIPW